MENWMQEQQDLLSQTVIEFQDMDRQDGIDQSFTFVYHNASGKKSKTDSFNDCLHWTKFDMFLIAETWYDDTVDNINIVAGTDFDLFRRDRGSNGGGVAIAIRKSIAVTSCEYWPECKFIEPITLRLVNECVTLIYWPPYNEKPSKVSSLNELLTRKSFKMRNLLIGDFNLTGLHWEHNIILDEMLPTTFYANAYEKSALAIIQEYGYIQMITRPNPNGKFLDLCLVTKKTSNSILRDDGFHSHVSPSLSLSF